MSLSAVTDPDPLEIQRERIRDHARAPEAALVEQLIAQADLSVGDRARIGAEAARFVHELREASEPGLMEVFLAEYGLSTDEGLALMCLAEALLRVPDAETVDALIEDKIAPGAWLSHFGHSASALVNASTLGLALTGRVLSRTEAQGLLGSAARRLGEPVIRTAVTRAMRELGQQFVLGQSIEEAAKRAAKLERDGFTYSYDMLGEAAMTAVDADAFFASYSHAIEVLAARARSADIRENPGISIKLSALHPRYEESQRTRVMGELGPRVLQLAEAAKAAGIGLNIDAEEADRLDLSLDVIADVLASPSLAGWDGFGVVVQA
ncbi:MAG: proline dehydrogenase family protein, partial [Pseudomonadota bacterium]